VLALGLVAGLAVLLNHTHEHQQVQKQAAAVKQDRDNYDEAYQQMNALRGRRKYSEALAIGQAYVDKSTNNANTAYMYGNIGAIYESQGDNQKALDAYRKGEQKAGKDLIGLDDGIARTSYALGDKKTALEYYKKSLAVYQKETNTRTNRVSIRELQDTIKQVEAEQ
jgi:tetratricopeptide (TPR) repeat protein